MFFTTTFYQSGQTKKTFIWFIAIFLFLHALLLKSQAAHNWTDQIAAFKPMVVNVETSSEVVFEAEAKGTSFATGFHR